jgi:hypothetical protein
MTGGCRRKRPFADLADLADCDIAQLAALVKIRRGQRRYQPAWSAASSPEPGST